MTIKYQIIYWRDIPAQVKVKLGRKRGGQPLSNRFPIAIDEAAMRAGITESDKYLAQWRNGEWQEREGDLEEVTTTVIAELEATYPQERLRVLIKQEGLERVVE
jgi:hypothetical protein